MLTVRCGFKLLARKETSRQSSSSHRLPNLTLLQTHLAYQIFCAQMMLPQMEGMDGRRTRLQYQLLLGSLLPIDHLEGHIHGPSHPVEAHKKKNPYFNGFWFKIKSTQKRK